MISAGIHMSDIPSFPYELLWEERTLGSVANLTRRDGEEFMRAGAAGRRSAPRSPPTRWRDANQALEDLRAGAFRGAAVLQISKF